MILLGIRRMLQFRWPKDTLLVAALYVPCGFLIAWTFHLAWYVVQPLLPVLITAAIAGLAWWLTGPHK